MIWKKMTHRRETLLFVVLPALCFILPLFGSSSVSAASVGTSSFDLYWRPTLNDSYRWKNGIVYGNTSGITGTMSMSARQYQFTTANVTATGNYATMHFETNLVSTIPGGSTHNSDYFVNLPQQQLLVCNGLGGFSGLRTVTKSLSYAVTPNWVSGNTSNSTLTFYGDITLAGLTSGQTGSFICAIGGSYDFFYSDYFSTTYINRLWFEKNPIDITFSTNETDALLRQQMNQNQQMIDQQQQIINQDNQDRDQLESSSQESQEEGESAGDNASDTGTTLFGAFTSLVAALTNVHQTNCKLSIPEVDFQNGGSFALGTLDLCTLDVPSGLSALGSLLLVFLIVPMGINCAKRMLSLYNELLGGK